MKHLLIIALLFVAACAAPSEYRAIMQNKKTGQTAECKHEETLLPVDQEAAMKHCVDAYEKAGYVRIDTK
jgi:gamma-glutamyl phosphate reductase